MANSLFTAKGEEAVASANKKNLDLKKVYIRLKEGESVRVRLLGITDDTVREYMAQGDFNLGIFTQPDIAPLLGEPSPLTVASRAGIEKFEKLYPKKRYLIVFADIDSGELRVFDGSKSQGVAVQDLMKEYDESKDDVAFTFKRTGTKTDTTYNLIPIMKLKPEDKEKFEAAGELKVDADFLDNVLVPRTKEQQIELLEKAGFPVKDFFGTKIGTETSTNTDVEEGTEEEIGTDETENF
ncbi:hypothetical protein NX029_26375 [Cytobacillus firmus]|nr:hypothetical protein [Cytobacillus firmus]